MRTKIISQEDIEKICGMSVERLRYIATFGETPEGHAFDEEWKNSEEFIQAVRNFLTAYDNNDVNILWELSRLEAEDRRYWGTGPYNWDIID